MLTRTKTNKNSSYTGGLMRIISPPPPYNIGVLAKKRASLLCDKIFCKVLMGEDITNLGTNTSLFVNQMEHFCSMCLTRLASLYGYKYLKGICPRGNNKIDFILFHVYDKCLFSC
jgi:hypothetical protein